MILIKLIKLLWHWWTPLALIVPFTAYFMIPLVQGVDDKSKISHNGSLAIHIATLAILWIGTPITLLVIITTLIDLVKIQQPFQYARNYVVIQQDYQHPAEDHHAPFNGLMDKQLLNYHISNKNAPNRLPEAHVTICDYSFVQMLLNDRTMPKVYNLDGPNDF